MQNKCFFFHFHHNGLFAKYMILRRVHIFWAVEQWKSSTAAQNVSPRYIWYMHFEGSDFFSYIFKILTMYILSSEQKKVLLPLKVIFSNKFFLVIHTQIPRTWYLKTQWYNLGPKFCRRWKTWYYIEKIWGDWNLNRC